MNRFKHFSIIFFPFFIILLIVSLLIYKGELKAEYISLESKSKYIVDMISGVIKDDLKGVEDDIDHLAEDYRSFVEAGTFSPGDGSLLVRDFIHFAEIKKMYSQVRILNNSGKEILRVNSVDGEPFFVPEEELQDKSSMEYVKKSINLKSGHIFVSPFDLNIENGQIEYPFNPVIRFIMPVFSPSGEKEGMIVLNYSGRYLLNRMRKIENTSYRTAGFSGKLMLLNEDGYWLMSDNPQDEWGFMFKEGYNRTFSNRYPEAWKAILSERSGILHLKEGMFAFDTVSISDMGMISNTEWKVVFFIPSGSIKAIMFLKWIDFIALTSLFSFILFVVSLFLAHSNIKREEAEKELEDLAKTDLLTSLYNRRFFLDQFEYERIRSERYHADISVVMGDIDHLKKINDRYGHEAGDYVLKTVAYIMKSGLRKQDTICRWGGEEFMIILPETSSKNAVIGVERIRSTIESYEFIYEGNALNVTMSFGVFQNSLDLTMEECIKRADEFLYLSKNKGRNMVSYMDESGL